MERSRLLRGSRVVGVIALLAIASLLPVQTVLADPDPASTTTSSEATSTTTSTAPSNSATPGAAAATGGVTAQAASALGYTVIEGNGCNLATIGLTDGVVTALPDGFKALTCVNDLGFGPNGVLYGIKQENGPLEVHLIRFDLTTGAPTDLGPLTGAFTASTMFGLVEGGIALGADGNLYGLFGTDAAPCAPAAFQCVYRIDPASLVATLVGPPGAAGSRLQDRSLLGLTGDCGTTTLETLIFDPTTDLPALVSLALANGAATEGATLIPSPAQLDGLEFDRTTHALYGLFEIPNEALYTVNLTTGALTKVADTSNVGRERGLAIPSDPCPSAPAPVLVQPRFTG